MTTAAQSTEEQIDGYILAAFNLRGDGEQLTKDLEEIRARGAALLQAETDKAARIDELEQLDEIILKPFLWKHDDYVKAKAAIKRLLLQERLAEVKSIQAEAYTGIGTVRQLERREATLTAQLSKNEMGGEEMTQTDSELRELLIEEFGFKPEDLVFQKLVDMLTRQFAAHDQALKQKLLVALPDAIDNSITIGGASGDWIMHGYNHALSNVIQAIQDVFDE